MFFLKNSALSNYEKVFFDFKIEANNGKIINLKDYENKVILIVNTASYCGFTKQYTDLQICMPSKTFTIKIPSYFQVKALYYHKDIPLGRKSYYIEGNEEKLPHSMLISEILPKSVLILYELVEFMI